jgi:hypothetical protein
MSKVVTRKNTNFAEWRKIAEAELTRLGVDLAAMHPLRIQHAYEFDEVATLWAQHYAANLVRQARTELVNRLNP